MARRLKEELDKRVRRLSVEGSALAQHLAESSLGAAGPARQLECARAHTASNVSESSSGDLTKRTVSQASNLRHHHPRTASRAIASTSWSTVRSSRYDSSVGSTV